MKRDAFSGAWHQATRVYSDVADRRNWRDIERDWLNRAEAACKAGNYLHIARALRICEAMDVAPPHWLVLAVHRVLPGVSAGTAGGVGRHAKLLSRAADAVRDVEALMQVHLARERGKAAGVRVSTIDAAAAYFDSVSAAPRALVLGNSIAPMHRARSRDALEKQVSRARRKLRDAEFRAFVGANFPPPLIAHLRSDRNK